MNRALVSIWLAPVAFFWSWYFLSYYDVAPTSGLYSRVVHDKVLAFYGNLLGIDPATLPALVAEALVLDALVVAAIVALRHHRAIAAFVRAHFSSRQSSPAESNAESLSSAP